MDCSIPGFPILHHLLEENENLSVLTDIENNVFNKISIASWANDWSCVSFVLLKVSIFILPEHEFICMSVICGFICNMETIVVAVCQLPSSVWSQAVISRTAAHQASLSLTISQSWHKFMSIASVTSSSHCILWLPLLLLPSTFPSIRDFSNEWSVCIRWPKYRSFSFHYGKHWFNIIVFILYPLWTKSLCLVHILSLLTIEMLYNSIKSNDYLTA